MTGGKGVKFESKEAYEDWLHAQSRLPAGFTIATRSFGFTPVECAKNVSMTLTLIELEKESASFAALFTRNKFPGAPVLVGRARLEENSIRAILVNNKVSNVGVASGVQDSELLCEKLASLLNCRSRQIIPSSTGVIGWRLPVESMLEQLPELLKSRQSESVLPAAMGIMTTDLFPKIRSRTLGSGSIVAIAKGAGMIEPNLATMLVYILSDIQIEREELRAALREAVASSFNCISVDSDQSTSDTVLAVSTNRVSGVSRQDFISALKDICIELAQDVVRNGEGVHHVLQVTVRKAPSFDLAANLGKTILRSPLVKTAICGNDPNVGRILMAIGNFADRYSQDLDFSRIHIELGGQIIFSSGSFQLDQQKEQHLVTHLRETELYASASPDEKGAFHPPKCFPVHQRNTQLEIVLNCGDAQATVWGGDLTHEYISENADYRS